MLKMSTLLKPGIVDEYAYEEDGSHQDQWHANYMNRHVDLSYLSDAAAYPGLANRTPARPTYRMMVVRAVL